MKKILIVDDNPANIGVLFECLENAGYKTLIAQDGKDAIEMAENILPDLILLDVIMPGIDGFETCKALKSKKNIKEIPVIFMTALSDTGNKVSGLKCGAVDYICKPFQQEEVIARIENHLTIKEQKDKLLSLNKEKEKMISVIAHDLRSPFNGILGMLQLLSNSYETFDEEEKLSYIKHLNDSAANVYQLVEELLNWAVTGNGELEYKPEKLNLNDLITTVISVAKDVADQKNIDLDIQIDPETYIIADSNMISTVIRNIISNAIKFTSKNGHIKIRTESENNFVILSVKDTGIGMKKDVVENILSGTKTLSTPGTENEQGTGLGLIISREFLEVNQGKMDIKSTPGQGTQFIISLPCII